MLPLLKRLWLALIPLVCAVQSAVAFSLLGPLNESYFSQATGFGEVPPSSSFGNIGGIADLGGPHNLGEGYRWNLRDVYYAYDANFWDYFGSNGVAAADQAFAMFNSLTNLSTYSSDLSEWPLTAARINHRAKALGLLDVKSALMSSLAEQLGLAQPERYTWVLETRDSHGAPCPNFEYQVIQRNFDPATYAPSEYVNGVQFSYYIAELCGVNPNVFAPLEADAVEFAPDPDSDTAMAVAVAEGRVPNGQYFTSLTRDDVGGLRYLMATNRINVEAISTNSLLVVTNNDLQLITASNLTIFSTQALTNGPAALQALYPGLLINSVSNIFTNVITTNIFAYFTNKPGSVVGSPAIPVLVTNYTTNAMTNFLYSFANVITNYFFTQGYVTTTTTNVVPKVGGVVGQVQTNVSSSTSLANFINGEFIIIPPTNQCGFSLVGTQLTTLVTITNQIVLATNAPGVTNILGPFSETIITYFTNDTFIAAVPQCLVTNVALREGIDKINFFRVDYDSLLGQAWGPITNIFTLTAVTNSAPMVQTFYRVITQPDILITAANLVSGPTLNGIGSIARSITYQTNQEGLNIAGPGLILPPVVFTFNKVGPIYDNPFSLFFIDQFGLIDNVPGSAIYSQTNSILIFQWGSFNGSTNAPIVYPDTNSLANLENQVFLQITVSGPLANGAVGVSYTSQLQATGIQPPPYTWSVVPGFGSLPYGLSLSPTTGLISGTPTTAGIYDFTVQAVDTTGRTSQRNFIIEIN